MYDNTYKNVIGHMNSSEIVKSHAIDTYNKLNMSQDGGINQ